jgi:hypothetical protein
MSIPEPNPRLTIVPAPSPEVAAAIVAALHAHRRRAAMLAASAADPATNRWLATGRRAALRADWPQQRAAGWRAAPR